MKKTITYRYIYEVNGKKCGKVLTFDLEVEKFAKLQSEDAVKRKIKETALGMKVLSRSELEASKCDLKEFIAAWREAKQAQDEKLACIDPNRITAPKISTLRSNEIFVFGSNLAGQHAGGAARAAYDYFGAIWGQGVGLQGQSYAIPTMHGGPDAILPYVDEFIEFARSHPQMMFLVTPIGCGIAGFRPEEIAPLFKNAKDVKNIALPYSFWFLLN